MPSTLGLGGGQLSRSRKCRAVQRRKVALCSSDLEWRVGRTSMMPGRELVVGGGGGEAMLSPIVNLEVLSGRDFQILGRWIGLSVAGLMHKIRL